ncbi:hypothetical protein [Streptomyces sp. NPDC058280]|uniref:hypothetical protein n=1 Tax=Streptomyces sp. NPDC058280 TaxID=3346419 RepID=UPI0036E0F909
MTTEHSTDGPGTDGWTAAVRQRLGLGRLLPLGEAADGAWLSEQAAVGALRRAAARVPGVALGTVRLSLAEPDAPGEPAVPPPPSALPPGPLRIDGEFAAAAGEPLLPLADRLREALSGCAVDRLGLLVTQTDLRVTALLDLTGESPAPAGPVEVPLAPPDSGPAQVVAAVPGVAHLTRALGPGVVLTPGHVRVELATAAGHRPLDVALAVRAAVTAALPGAPSVAVLVSAMEAAPDAP